MKFKNQIVRFVAMVVAVLFTFSCTEDDKKEVTRLQTTDAFLVENAGKYSILRSALAKTGLLATLQNAGSYTIFAPSNAAFAAKNITQASVDALSTTNPADAVAIANLRVVLQNHVLTPGTRAADLLAGGYFRTFGFFRANAPLAPSPATPLLTTGSQLSIFVNKVGDNVLINGGPTNGGATVTKADIDLSNGVLHEIDAVLDLPTILNHLVANPAVFGTLVTVVTSTSGTFGDQTAVRNIVTGATNLAARTIMCPTNTAFTNATSGTGFLQGAIVTPANITKVLQYHVLPPGNRIRTFFADNFVVNTSIPTPTQTWTSFTTGTLGARIQDNGTAPNNIARYALPEIQGVNGILHPIDKVLQPILP